MPIRVLFRSVPIRYIRVHPCSIPIRYIRVHPCSIPIRVLFLHPGVRQRLAHQVGRDLLQRTFARQRLDLHLHLAARGDARNIGEFLQRFDELWTRVYNSPLN